MLSLGTQNQLIADIYDASIKPELWETVLESCAQQWHANIVNMIVGDKLNPSSTIVYAHGATPEQIQMYMSGGFAELDMKLVLEWVNRGTRIGDTSTNDRIFGSIENFKAEAGDYYSKFCTQVNVLHQLGSLLELNDYRYSFMGMTRRHEDNRFSDNDITNAATIIPHIRRAIQIHHQLSHVREMQARLYRMLDRMVAAVLLLDAAGRVRYANPAADALLSRHTALRVGLNHEFAVRDDALQHRLSQLINSAIRTGLREKTRIALDEAIIAGGVLGIRTANSASPLMLTVTPLSEMSGYGDLASDGIAAGVFITDPSAHRVLARPLLQQHFQLSEREMDVCEAFVNTATLENIADALGLSLNTVRAHIKTIYEKTGHRSQAELMKLLLGLTIEFEHIQ